MAPSGVTGLESTARQATGAGFNRDTVDSSLSAAAIGPSQSGNATVMRRRVRQRASGSDKHAGATWQRAGNARYDVRQFLLRGALCVELYRR